MKVQRLGVKFFLKEPREPEFDQVIRIFHEWIQKQVFPDHLLIDVHNYSHIDQGPGILLVGHEGNFSLDLGEGRPGLQYIRKQPLPGGPEERLRVILGTALEACRLLEDHTGPRRKMRFAGDEFVVLANDRLGAPPTDSTRRRLSEIVAKAFREDLGIETRGLDTDPRERTRVLVRLPASGGVEGIRERLG